MNINLHVIYSYYEGNPDYKMNLIYFLKKGYLSHVNYIFIVNGSCTVDFPVRENITVIRRENTGFDFQGYYTGLISLKKKNMIKPKNFYIFLNCTVRGPFLPPYVTTHLYWYTPYLDLLTDQVKLVGSVINGYITPHVQTYMFMMDYEGVNFLLENNFFKTCSTRDECINQQEIALSQLILSKGWNIDCLVPEYHGIDYRKSDAMCHKNDIRLAKSILGRDLLPYEVIFIKSGWGDPSNQISSLTDVNCIGVGTTKHTCQKITYGVTENKSINVTHIIQNMKYINSHQLKPNSLFGDPYPEQAKYLFIYVEKQAKALVLRELENRIVSPQYFYIFDNRGDFFLFYQHSLQKLL